MYLYSSSVAAIIHRVCDDPPEKHGPRGVESMRANINTNQDAVTFPEWPVCALVSIIKLRVAQTRNAKACVRVCVCEILFHVCHAVFTLYLQSHRHTSNGQNGSISNVRFGFRNGWRASHWPIRTNCNRNAYGTKSPNSAQITNLYAFILQAIFA